MVLVLASSACSGTAGPAGPVASGQPVHSGHVHPVPPSPAPLRAGERFVTLAMPQAYAPAAPSGGNDEYRCFLVDPGLTATAYLTGSQFLQDNVDLVHHAIFFRIPPADVDKARAVDARTRGEGWRCFGDAGIGGDDVWVAQWAPGTNEVLLRSGLGYELPPGSQLVMQVHYNLLASGGKAGGSDRSSIRLRLA